MFLKRTVLKHGSLQRFFTQRNTSYRSPPPKKKGLQKYEHSTYLHAITDLNQLNCKHTTFLHATTDLNQLNCKHTTFLHAITDLNQLNCKHTIFLHAITDLNQLNCKHSTFLHAITDLNQLNCNNIRFLHAITNVNQLNCNHATFLHSTTNLNQLNCNNPIFLQTVTNLNELHRYHDTFIPATTNVNQSNRNHVTFLYDTINVNQLNEATNLNRQRIRKSTQRQALLPGTTWDACESKLLGNFLLDYIKPTRYRNIFLGKGPDITAAQTEMVYILIFKCINYKHSAEDFSTVKVFMECILFLISLRNVLILPLCFMNQRRQ
jgi:hypothetical protein